MNLDLDNSSYNLNKSGQYSEQINSLNSMLHVLLNEFKNIYIISKMNSSNQEYSQQFSNIMSNINQFQEKLFNISNEIQENINDLNKQLVEMNISIQYNKKQNIELKKQLGLIENKNNSSEEMIKNYKDIYDYNYLRNWALCLSTLICLFSISKINKPQIV